MTRVPAGAEKNTNSVMAADLIADFLVKPVYIKAGAYMKKFSIIMIVIFVSLSLFSCDFESPPREETFWARNSKTNEYYKLEAELLYKGRYCNVWVETGTTSGSSLAWQVGDEYDKKIYPKMMEAFGNNYFNGDTFLFNTVEFASFLADGDGKLTILLLDIKDHYEEGVNNSYTAGYFWGGDLTDDPNSNRRAIIYIDTYPGLIPNNITETYKTVAHELQHMMNFVTSILERAEVNKNNEITKIYFMDTWIDEGLSGAAEWVYSGEHSESRWGWYLNNGNESPKMSGLINLGNNFYVWGNKSRSNLSKSLNNGNDYAVLDDYATVYLFFQWLRLQNVNFDPDYGKQDIYYYIIMSENPDYKAVTDAAAFGLDNYDYNDWDALLATWLSANYFNNSSGIYGYMNESDLREIRAHSVPTGQTTISLFSGEGVYSRATSDISSTLTGQGTNIKNKYLASGSTNVSDNFISSGALLTFNASTNNKTEVSQSGKTTGVGFSVQPSEIYGGRSVFGSFNGRYPIGAGDLLHSSLRNKATSGAVLNFTGKTSSRALRAHASRAHAAAKPFPFDLRNLRAERFVWSDDE